MSKYPKIAVFSTVGPCGLAMSCVVFDINWAIVRKEWLFGAFVGVAWRCGTLLSNLWTCRRSKKSFFNIMGTSRVFFSKLEKTNLGRKISSVRAKNRRNEENHPSAMPKNERRGCQKPRLFKTIKSGVSGIRTHGEDEPHTRFRVWLLRPLGHRSWS